MPKFIFNNNNEKLPVQDKNTFPVQIYDTHKWNAYKSSSIGSGVLNSIRNLGCPVSTEAFDFLTISLAVTAADTFFKRELSDNSWARIFELDIPLAKPQKWFESKITLERALGFLTGDQWTLNFQTGGLNPPPPKKSKLAIKKAQSLRKLNCACLFSGGLDSAVGAIDLVNQDGPYRPILISHACKGDASKQKMVEQVLTPKKYSAAAFNANPHIISQLKGQTDITMRSRSFNFLAMATIGLSAVQYMNSSQDNLLFVPENGFISLNPPLTPRRLGSLSTRTTHPYFISLIQEVLDWVGINAKIVNRYQAKTKGQMLRECLDKKALSNAIPSTVSCSNWHRKGIQCGRCLPCIIRRSAIHYGGFTSDASYQTVDLSRITNESSRDDLFALIAAISKMNSGANIAPWVRLGGPLPSDQKTRTDLMKVFPNGLKEVEQFLKSVSVI